MLERAYQLSSSWEFFTEECTRLENVFSKLHYPANDINRIINRFVLDKTSSKKPTLDSTTTMIARVPLPFKNQKSADLVVVLSLSLGSLCNVSRDPCAPEHVLPRWPNKLSYYITYNPLVSSTYIDHPYTTKA